MEVRHLSQEAHLWYTLSSPAYIRQAQAKLQAASALMHAGLASDPEMQGYAPVPYWGGVVDSLVATFDNAVAHLEHGDFDPMHEWASTMTTIPRGIKEGNMAWMPQMGEFMDLIDQSFTICNDFSMTVIMSAMCSSPRYKEGTVDWAYEIPQDMAMEGNNIARIHEEGIFPKLPREIPEYAPDISVTCQTGEIVPWTGVWVPTTGMGTAALAFARKDIQVMQPAYEVASRDEDGYPIFKQVECAWHPVKPTGRMVAHPVLAALQLAEASAPRRVEGGNRCTKAGRWFTPAGEGASRSFELGEVMPHLDGFFGRTYWQWAG